MRKSFRAALVLAPFALVAALAVSTQNSAGEAGHAHAAHAAPAKAVPAVQTDCAEADRRAALATEQRNILKKLGSLVILRNQQDVDRLAGLGFDSYAHWQASLYRLGWTPGDLDLIINPQPGKPNLLLYRPNWNGNNGPADGYDFPYVLAGWAYLAPYDFQRHPGLVPCMKRADWILHERGIHTANDGGFVPVQPAEERPGTAPGNDPPAAQPPSFGHGRSWVLHLWFNGTRTPTVSLWNPGKPIPGVAEPEGSFWYPPAP